MKRQTKEKIKDAFLISMVVLILGGGIFAATWMAMDSGYGACLIVRCVKIIP